MATDSTKELSRPAIRRLLVYYPSVADYYRPHLIEEVFARTKRIEQLMAPDDPMLFIRPELLKRLQPEGASLN